MKSRPGKSIKILTDVFSVIVILIAVFVMVFSSVVDRDGKSLFGFRAFTVGSEDLSTGGFDPGDIVITKPASVSELESGDIISFFSQNEESFGKTVVRHIRSVSENGFVTYNSVTDEDDLTAVSAEEITGKYAFSIPKAGSFFAFLKTVPGYILCVFIPVLILIIIRGISCVALFKRYRDEQLSEIKSTKRAAPEAILPKEPEIYTPFEDTPEESESFENEPLPADEPKTETEIIEEPEIQKEPELPEKDNANIFENETKQEIPIYTDPTENETEPSLEEMLTKLRDLRKDLDLY